MTVLCVPGFKVWGVRNGKYGVAIIFSEEPCSAFLLTTKNKVKAAPLIVSERRRNNKIHGIVANSGNANAMTGDKGIEDAERMCSIAAKATGVAPENFLVASTGVIGRPMPMEIIEELIKNAASRLECSSAGVKKAARAIMTTDTFEKLYSKEIRLTSGEAVRITGIAKGAGMIAPNLGTMLCFIFTDAFIPREAGEEILARAVEESFNQVVIDGDTSTNDMVVLLSNGKAGNKTVDENFARAVEEVCVELAKMIARDGEGATKYIEVVVRGAKTKEDARKAARAVVSSNLVKTAVFGGDPNWGRIAAAIGYSGAEVEPEKLSLFASSKGKRVCLVEKGKPVAVENSEELKIAEEIFKDKEIFIEAELNLGEGEARAYGCDMSYEYVRINAEYTT